MFVYLPPLEHKLLRAMPLSVLMQCPHHGRDVWQVSVPRCPALASLSISSPLWLLCCLGFSFYCTSFPYLGSASPSCLRSSALPLFPSLQIPAYISLPLEVVPKLPLSKRTMCSPVTLNIRPLSYPGSPKSSVIIPVGS